MHLMRSHIALIAALVEKIGNRKCDCTRLQSTYAYKLDISTWRYTPMINISHYVSTETLSRKEIHMFETRTHTQCLPDYSIHWWAWLQEETQSNTSCNTLLCHLHKQQHSSAGYLPGQFSCGHTHHAMIQYICICLCIYLTFTYTALITAHVEG